MSDHIEEMARKMAEQMLAEMLKEKGISPAETEIADERYPQPIHGAKRLEITDPKLDKRVETFFRRLEQYFPEHKVFALDALDKELRERLSKLYKALSYPTANEMLHAYGYEIIAGDAIRELRSFVLYEPGDEPAFIKPKVDNLMALFLQYYPDRVVADKLNTHTSIASKISGLYRWLGYASIRDMLEAYGFQYLSADNKGGSPTKDVSIVIDTLVERYRDRPVKPLTVKQLRDENPDIAGRIKTLSNDARKLFGKTLPEYLAELGVMAPPSAGGVARTPRKENVVLEKLEALYRSLDGEAHGSTEDLLAALQPYQLKMKMGIIALTDVLDCPAVARIPYGIEEIGRNAFRSCQRLEKVELPPTVQKIAGSAFADCASLRVVTLAEGLTQIDSAAFEGCTALTEIEIPATVDTIKNGAFQGCENLASVVYKNPMTMVQKNAFANCPLIEAQIEQIGQKRDGMTFERGKSGVTLKKYTGRDEVVEIPPYIANVPVTEIASCAFQNNQYVAEIRIPETVQTIGNRAFENCISLKALHLPEGVSKLYSATFKGCTALKEINIPDGIVELKKNTFQQSPLRKLHIGKGLHSVNSDIFFETERNDSGTVIAERRTRYVSVSAENRYMKAEGTMLLSADGKTLLAVLAVPTSGTLELPEGIERIAEDACSDLGSLQTIVFPQSLAEIGDRAFYGTSLREVTFPPSLRCIGDRAFYLCRKMTVARFAEGLEEIGRQAFYNCPMPEVSLPATVRVLGQDCLPCMRANDIYGMGDLRLKTTLTIDPANPYYRVDGRCLYDIKDGQQKLFALLMETQKDTEIKIALGTTHIQAGVFTDSYNSAFHKVVLPEGVVEIEDNAFRYCMTLRTVVLPDTLQKIGANAFRGTNISSLRLPVSLTELGAGALPLENLRKITVAKKNPMFYAEENALFGRDGQNGDRLIALLGERESWTVPDGVTEICQGAFSGAWVAEVTIPATVKTIQPDAFLHCKSLKRINLELAEPQNGIKRAVIYIPDTQPGQAGLAATQDAREQYLDCIRTKADGVLFDFAKYDSLFDSIKSSDGKILVAIDRLKSAIDLTPVYRDKYLSYLRRRADKAVEVVVVQDNLAGLHTLTEFGIFTGKNIDALIDLANNAKQPEILSYLMQFKNESIGVQETDYEL